MIAYFGVGLVVAYYAVRWGLRNNIEPLGDGPIVVSVVFFNLMSVWPFLCCFAVLYFLMNSLGDILTADIYKPSQALPRNALWDGYNNAEIEEAYQEIEDSKVDEE